MTAQLIVTADDVGLHPGMNAGAIEAHERGIVTACSIVANGEAFEDAVRRLKDHPRLDVGLHLTLVEERPVEPLSRVASLVDADGKFFRNFKRFVLRYGLGRIRVSEVERELAAQIEKALAVGLKVTHLNGHQHLHVLPAVFESTLRLAELYSIPYVRTPAEGLTVEHVSMFRQTSMRMLNRFGMNARRMAREAGVFTNSRTIGIAQAGHLDRRALLSLIDRLEGVTELVTHPGIGSAEIARMYNWGYNWDTETLALCDPAVREAIRARRIDLVGVRQAVA